MAYLRRLPSGKWQATVRLPNGRKTTRTDALKRVVEGWARGLETDVARGRWRDPRAGRRVTLEQWRREWLAQRIVAPATASKNETHWRLHIAPVFGAWPLDAVDRAAIRGWVAQLYRDGAGAHTIEAAARHLAKLLADAVEADLLAANPAARLRLPTPPLRLPFFWTRDEAADLLRALDGPMRTLVDLDLHTGLRIGEVTGLWCEQIDWEAGLVHVTAAQTRYGRQRYTKGRKLRTVPVPPHLLDALLELVSGRAPDCYVFTAPEGGPIDDRLFRRRVFVPALERAHVRRGTVHDLRHTCASWLAQAGVSLYEIQALLGHESFRTTQRYAHLAPSAFDAITSSWARAAGAPLAHGPPGWGSDDEANGL